MCDDGEAVRLFYPVSYGKKPDVQDPSCSFIGGEIQSEEFTKTCPLCEDPLFHIVQLHVPGFQASSGYSISKTLQVFACNKASCFTKLFEENEGKLAYGGHGVVVCRRAKGLARAKQEDVSSSPKIGDSQNGSAIDDDWGVVGSSIENTMDDLEEKLARMKVKKNTVDTSTSKSPNKTKGKNSAYELTQVQEPRAANLEDEDDVGLHSGNQKIQAMLAKYLAEEEDSSILEAIQGSVSGSAGGGQREKDERLSADDRALLTFTDRLKRFPQQVVRYSQGGQPLWSIPVLPVGAKQPHNQAARHTVLQPIPRCSCGAERVFEMQVLPSVLSTLNVDKHVEKTAQSSLEASYADGGMDFANIAIFSCPDACSTGEEYVVVQRSLDEYPVVPNKSIQAGDVLIADDAKFDSGSDDESDDSDGCDEDDLVCPA